MSETETTVDRDLRPFGWAPGDYGHAKCASCSSYGPSNWWGGDKRAWNCKPCAERLAAEHDASDCTPFSPLPTPVQWGGVPPGWKLVPIEPTFGQVFAGRAKWVGGWQPIETAPKDGTEILAWGLVRGCDIKVVVIAYWSNPMPGLAHPAWRMMQDTMNQEFLAEHWQPLPNPPQG